MATCARAKALDSTTHEVAMENRYQDLVEEVSELVADRLLEDHEWLENNHALELDAVMFQLVMRIGLAALEELLNRLATIKYEECRGEGMHISSKKKVSQKTKLGEVTVRSPYMRNPHTRETARPMKDVFGVEGEAKTPALERALSDFGSEDSYADAESRFKEHYGFSIGRTSILRATNRVGEDAEAYLDERLGAYREPSPEQSSNSVDEIMVQLDGCAIRTGEYMTARRAGLAGEEEYAPDDRVRDVEWKEVRVGLVRCGGEVTKQYVARKDNYDEICQQLRALARSKGLDDDTKVISPGDGGNGLKEAIEEVFPDVQFILDFSHLRDHFYETAEEIGVDEQLRNQWVADFLDTIWEGQLEEVLKRLRDLYRQNEHNRLDRLIRYLERFSECLDYAEYEEAGWPTGSGEVESSHQYIPQDRLKLPGACWDEASINPMLAIRVIKKNGWWDDFWDWRTDKQENAA